MFAEKLKTALPIHFERVAPHLPRGRKLAVTIYTQNELLPDFILLGKL